MIRVICHVPGGRYRGGRRHDAGISYYPDDTFTDDQIMTFRDDQDFDIELGVNQENGKNPESLSVDEAVDKAIDVLSNHAEEYGINTKDLRKDIRVIFAEAEGIRPDVDNDEDKLHDVIAACVELVSITPRDEDKFAGAKPKTSVLSEMVGFRVSGQLRDMACESMTGE